VIYPNVPDIEARNRDALSLVYAGVLAAIVVFLVALMRRGNRPFRSTTAALGGREP
jgi:hypothetical protein